ncbi:RNA polymerase sigma factor [Wukongibacter sp. M2B1]|uniref:RNA polymerase sigma factor n=1 Tax=Wukongibacter sp. M2B1 TaxID=3088895 RepID=UPI003D7AEF84
MLRVTEDIEIIEKILKGDISAFEILINKYNKKIFGYIIRSVRYKHIAEELTQEVFLKIYRNLNKFDKNLSFSVWLFTIARNTTIDYLKSSKSQYTYELNEDLDSNRMNNTLQNPLDIIEKKENGEILYRIINSLPNKYKELIVLKYFEELSYCEISKRLDMPVNKVKWRLYEARKKIIKAFGNNEKEKKRWDVYGV